MSSFFSSSSGSDPLLNRCRFCLKKSSKKSVVGSSGCACPKLPSAHADCLQLYITSTGLGHCGHCGEQFKQVTAGADGSVALQQLKEVLSGAGDGGEDGGGALVVIPSSEAYYSTYASLFDRLLIGLLLYLYVVLIAPQFFEGRGYLLKYLIGHLLFYLLTKALSGELRSLDLYRYFKAKQASSNNNSAAAGGGGAGNAGAH